MADSSTSLGESTPAILALHTLRDAAIDPATQPELAQGAIRLLVDDIHAANRAAGWWTDLKTGEPLQRNVGEMLMLVVSELAEAWLGFRGRRMDDHLPHHPMTAVELADTLIRVFDLAGGMRYRIDEAAVEVLRNPELFPDVRPPMPAVAISLLDLICTVAAAMEGHRKDRQDDRLPQFKQIEVELACLVLRIVAWPNPIGKTLPAVVTEKRAYNAQRADHKPEARKAAGGKAYR